MRRQDHQARAASGVCSLCDAAAQNACPLYDAQTDVIARGCLQVEGKFLALHHDSVEKLLRGEIRAAANDAPLEMVVGWHRDKGERTIIVTTTGSLARLLGEALVQAFGGDLRSMRCCKNGIGLIKWHCDREADSVSSPGACLGCGSIAV